ncbi:hypothetical protein HPB51_024075 [Rhipicephalus microplus]|uniref:HAT C-terminal dimerisation domain-containing protein n=1 Tax=Rhipicephalus microplus TaxID=6941 RepID=A0A9J6EDB1_RHIMP|nr:hypothetical protein HPB51_024075 [Rhipicephalus microplus]
MGRKRKTLDDWCKEHEDLQIATKASEGTRTLVCKYCNTEMVTDPAKKPYDRIHEHLTPSRHKKFKTASKEAETAETSQQTLFDMSCRQRAKETEADGVIHDFVRALAYSGISMHQADGPLGDFARKYCKAAKTMPTGQRLRLKYLKEAFDKDMEKIRDYMRDVKVSVIVDESPDITGVPTINTLLCYYSQKNVKKHVVLVDVDRVNASNSYTVASAASKALLTVGKTWKDVVAVATDSAEYVRKMVREICQAEGIQILHVKDIAHLIHKRLLGQSFEDYRPLFMSVIDNVDSLNEEFNQYLLEASPTNPAVELIEYWHDSTSRYPRLAKAALTLLCLANGSCDVERTFSQLRYVQRPDRSRMETDMLRMQMIMYVNKDA